MSVIKPAGLYRALRAFRSARNGNVAIIFAIALFPLVAAVGAAVDYSRASMTRTAMLNAIDAAALMLSKEAQALTPDDLKKKANDYFKAMFNRPDVTDLVVTPTFTTTAPGNFSLVIKVTGKLDTTFTKAIGHDNMNLLADATIVWGIRRLEVALALDNTGSMSSQNRMRELKKATKLLLQTLKDAAKKPDDIKVAIIPFDIGVNIGTWSKDEPWFDTRQIDCNGSQPGKGCSGDDWKKHWDGCVRDRTQTFDVQDTSPDEKDPSTLYPVFSCGSLAEVLPLTNDWTKLDAKVDQMNPSGNTNITIGLAWGWHTLTGSVPYTQASAPMPDLDKVLILLTDGDNTEAWDNKNGRKITSESTINGRTSAACTNIKAANIRVFTILLVNGNEPLLKGCASSPTSYYKVDQASQLADKFKEIAQNLANLRIAK